jgi:nicotinate-nucleotide adenylyltransferase
LRHHEVVVYPRDSYPGTIQVPLLPVSSTDIRRMVKNGEDISSLVPSSIISDVERYYQ